MHIDNKVTKEIDSIIFVGNSIISKAQSADTSLQGNDLSEVSSWVTRLGHLLLKLYGSNSQHYKNFKQATENKDFYVIHRRWYNCVSQVQGIASTVKHDIDNDLIGSIKGLLQAEIFASFLEIGEHLLSEGYKDAAAVTIGAVLEDGLRELCKNNTIEIIKPNGVPLTIEPLNIELAKHGVYSKLVQKQVTSWAHIRNKAAHGEYGEYDKSQVEMMLLFVQNFASQYLTQT